MAVAAQSIFDDWNQDEHGYDDVYGEGGICDPIANAMVQVIDSANLHLLVQSEDLDEHVDLLILAADGIWRIDLPSSIYEVHHGLYRWRKIHGVQFSAEDLTFELVDPNPGNYLLYGLAIECLHELLAEKAPSTGDTPHI
jgi:hypothetical protein